MQEEEKARQLAIRYLARFNVSVQKLICYLEQKGINGSIAEKVAFSLQKEGCLNDFDYACAYVQRKKSKFGPYRIYSELLKKGVSREVAGEALKNYSEDEERKVLETLIASYFKKNAGLERNKLKRKLEGFLARRGFKQDLILAALRDWKLIE